MTDDTQPTTEPLATPSSPDEAAAAPDAAAARFAAAADKAGPGFISELASFLWQNKLWWMFPILVALIVLALLIFTASGPGSPFIYTLF